MPNAIPSRLRSQGFTLIEVMIVVAIIGILAAIAIPSYNDYIRRGQLPEAFGAMADYRVKMEQYYQDNRSYGSANCADGNGGTAPTWASWPVSLKYFKYECALGTGGQGYTITATGINGQAIGHTYTINDANARTTTSFKGATVSQNCWLVKSACDN